MSNYSAEGELYKVFDTEQKSGTFTTREFVIRQETNNAQYPEFLKFQLVQDRCDIIDAYNVGDDIRVHFNLKGREWQEKFFTNLQAWRVERTSQEVSRKPKEELKSQHEQKEAAQEPNPGYDDLPF
jgi:single-strand DNA-binding protein